MSDSYKHTPGFTDVRSGSPRRKFYKRLAQKRIRKMEDIGNGGEFKRATGDLSYAICDDKTLAFTNADRRRLERKYENKSYRIYRK